MQPQPNLPTEAGQARPKPLPDAERLSRHGWALWAITFTVLLALTATVGVLYYPLVDQAGSEHRDELFQNAYITVVGLSGLVLIFCLYAAMRHRDLERMRKMLIREGRESDDVRVRLSELSMLFQLSTTLNLQLRLDAILEIIVRRVVATLRAQQASIMIYNPETGLLETRATYGLEAEFARNARKKLGEGIAGWVAEQQKAVLLQGKTQDQLGRHFKTDRNITSALSLPLRVGERCVGVLNVNRINHPEPFEERHREMLNLFAEHVGAVIDRAEAMERLGMRSRQLEQDNQKLTEMNQMKDRFLSTASHELKTPLTSVIAYSEILDDNETQLSRDQSHEFLRRLRAEADRLLSLIEDILDLTKLESGKMTLRRRPMPVNEIAHAAVETSRSMASKYNVTIEEKFNYALPQIPIDEVKMRQVVVNLLVNAVKFSPEKGKVIVETDREPHWVRIEVRDQGPGIKPEETAHIFELFGQDVSGEGEKRGGLGIGLHLVKRITELHGGHVGVNTLPGKGSAFWVRLPLALAEGEEQQAPTDKAAAA